MAFDLKQIIETIQDIAQQLRYKGYDLPASLLETAIMEINEETIKQSQKP